MGCDAQLAATQTGRERKCPGECTEWKRPGGGVKRREKYLDPHAALQVSTCSDYDICT